VFLTYRALEAVDDLVARASTADALLDFAAVDGVRHTIWRTAAADRDRLVAAFASVPALYIADGHHRAASAARTYHDMRHRGLKGTDLGDGAGSGVFLGVAFPHDLVKVLPYNRIAKDLGGRTPGEFVNAVATRFRVTPGPATPARKGDIAMYLPDGWRTLTLSAPPPACDATCALDVSVLQDQLLNPILGIADVRTDKRIDFVGGARGTRELEQLVDSGKAAVAFSLFPVSVEDLMTVCDAGSIMPPKSTWFEPKLRDGLLIHVI
jgi:uncharacterized protein (DUF1015 family)